MKIRSILTAILIIAVPFVIGLTLLKLESRAAINEGNKFINDTRENNQGIIYKGIKIDWSFCPDWKFKPLFQHEEEYLVFVFHYKNSGDKTVQLMPSYTCYSPDSRSYSANEEISMYIENEVEDKLKVKDETPVTYRIFPGGTKHYIVTFEKPHSLNEFHVDVDIFRDAVLRLNYRKKDGTWENYENKLENEYKGRG